MRKITIDLDDNAYNLLQEALQADNFAVEDLGLTTVKQWLEHELNNNTDCIIEMLLSDY